MPIQRTAFRGVNSDALSGSCAPSPAITHHDRGVHHPGNSEPHPRLSCDCCAAVPLPRMVVARRRLAVWPGGDASPTAARPLWVDGVVGAARFRLVPLGAGGFRVRPARGALVLGAPSCITASWLSSVGMFVKPGRAQ